MSKANTTGKKNSKAKFIVIGIVIIVIIAAVAIIASSVSMMSNMAMADTVKLEKKTIENTISFSGIVESQTFQKVSANLQYNVETVNAEVGDKVKKGDVLATLNSDSIQDQILQQQAAIDNSNINTEYSLTNAEKNYNEAREQIADGTYPEIRNAKMSLDNAETALRKAQEKYDEQLEIAGTDDDSQLISARKSVESAKYELDCAYNDYSEIKDEVENEDYSDIKDLKEKLDDAKKEYDSRYSSIKSNELEKAKSEYENAVANYSYMKAYVQYDANSADGEALANAEAAVKTAQAKLSELEAKYNVKTTEDTYEDTLEAYNKAKADIDSANSTKLKNAERSYERAKTSYENAKNNLTAVENGNETSLDSYETAVNDAQKNVDEARKSYDLALKNAESTLANLKANADREKVLSENNTQLISLEILKEQLDECVITAPCDGTITAVNAVEGDAAVGVMFIIEDTDNLKMTASVKEYSVPEIKTGSEVTVTIPSINNKEFKGVINKIAPAGNKGADGKSDGTASFKVEVIIHDTAGEGVLIGMNSKCSAVTGSAENVFSVGYDSLVEEEDGCYIFAADMIEGGNGTATARRIDVTTGFESDASIEIHSDELTEGMEILTNAGELTDGQVVLISSVFGEALESAMAEQQ